MKRAMILLIAVLMLCTLLTGCMNIAMHMKDISADEIESIDIYYNYEEKIDGRGTGNIQTREVIYSIPEEDIKEFVSELKKEDFEVLVLLVPAAVDYYRGEYEGWEIRLNFKDGGYRKIQRGAYWTYDADGGVWRRDRKWDEEDMRSLLEKYVPPEIMNEYRDWED